MQMTDIGVEDKKADLDKKARAAKERLDQLATTRASALDSFPGDPDKIVAYKEGLTPLQIDAILELTTEALCESAQEDRTKMGLFEKLDKNKDGSLSRDEFKAFGKSQGISDDNQTRFFSQFDTNKDGVISKNEFLAWFQTQNGGGEATPTSGEEKLFTRQELSRYTVSLALPWIALLGYQKVSAVRKPTPEPNTFDPTRLKGKPVETAFTEKNFEAVTSQMYNKEYDSATVSPEQPQVKPAMKISLFGENSEILPKKNNNKMMPDTKAVVKDDLQVKASSAVNKKNEEELKKAAEIAEKKEEEAKKAATAARKEEEAKETAAAKKEQEAKKAAVAVEKQVEEAAAVAEEAKKKAGATAIAGATVASTVFTATKIDRGAAAISKISGIVVQGTAAVQAAITKLDIGQTASGGAAATTDMDSDEEPLQLPKLDALDIPTASALPPDWEEATDPSSGYPYYYNTKTRVTTWEKPE